MTYHKIHVPSASELKKLWLQQIREKKSRYLSANDEIFKMAPRLIKRVPSLVEMTWFDCVPHEKGQKQFFSWGEVEGALFTRITLNHPTFMTYPVRDTCQCCVRFHWYFGGTPLNSVGGRGGEVGVSIVGANCLSMCHSGPL